MDAEVTGAELQFREFFAAEYGRLRGLGYLLTSDWGRPRSWPRTPWSGPTGPGRGSAGMSVPAPMPARCW